MTLKRRLKNFSKQFLRKLFERMQSFGVSILPVHFYSQIPVISELKKDLYWKAPGTLHAIHGSDTKQQLFFVQNCFDGSLAADIVKKRIHKTAVIENGQDEGYNAIDADFLYAFTCHYKPAKIIQVGCGVSTSVILRAAKDSGYSPEMVCVEPFPTSYLSALAAGGRITLVKEKAQKVDLNILTKLGPNDLFFVDSTHTVKPGSEVNMIILEVLPRLEKGVWVHFHDIYFPYDYQREILTKELFFSAETSLLQAFLTLNATYTIRASLSMLHYAESDNLKKCLLQYNPRSNDFGLEAKGGEHFPSSIYLEVV